MVHFHLKDVFIEPFSLSRILVKSKLSFEDDKEDFPLSCLLSPSGSNAIKTENEIKIFVDENSI